jgi:hypothetical protein
MNCYVLTIAQQLTKCILYKKEEKKKGGLLINMHMTLECKYFEK